MAKNENSRTIKNYFRLMLIRSHLVSALSLAHFTEIKLIKMFIKLHSRCRIDALAILVVLSILYNTYNIGAISKCTHKIVAA